MLQLLLLLSLFAPALCQDSWSQDLRRARQRVPRDIYRGPGSLIAANVRLNKHLSARVGLRLKACEAFAVRELRDLLRILHQRSSDELKKLYTSEDGRAAQYSTVAEMQDHWASHAPEDDERVRDAHCHEAVMWFVHQLTTAAQSEVIQTIVLPMLPVKDHTGVQHLRGGEDKAADFYKQKTTCQKCHVDHSAAPPAAVVTDQRKPTILIDTEGPPVMAQRFHIEYTEYTAEAFHYFSAAIQNNGSFHYDIANHRSVWVHGKGQVDNWCQCAGLKENTHASCSIVAAPSDKESSGGATYLVFKDIKKCCKLGTYEKGFGPLKPNWLSDANKSGSFTANDGRACTTWQGGPPGDWFMMISDDWSVDEQGRPCRYEDNFKWFARHIFGVSHYYDFHADTYSEEAEPDDVFNVPEGMGCEQDCPNTAGGWCSAR